MRGREYLVDRARDEVTANTRIPGHAMHALLGVKFTGVIDWNGHGKTNFLHSLLRPLIRDAKSKFFVVSDVTTAWKSRKGEKFCSENASSTKSLSAHLSYDLQDNSPYCESQLAGLSAGNLRIVFFESIRDKGSCKFHVFPVGEDSGCWESLVCVFSFLFLNLPHLRFSSV